MLGLCSRAGKLAKGEYAVTAAVKNRGAQLVIVACDASDNTKKSFRDMSSYRSIPLRNYGTKDSLGHCTGAEYTASLAVLDAGFAKSLLKLIDSEKMQ